MVTKPSTMEVRPRVADKIDNQAVFGRKVNHVHSYALLSIVKSGIIGLLDFYAAQLALDGLKDFVM